MTKTEYREYLASSAWQETRQAFLLSHPQCNQCHIPRWLTKIFYDQDLHVHHLRYRNLGDEDWDDLEALCMRCHEIKTFGHTQIRPPKTFQCVVCNEPCFDPYLNPPFCLTCHAVESLRYLPATRPTYGGGVALWEELLWVVALQVKTDDIIDYLAGLEERRNARKLEMANNPCPF